MTDTPGVFKALMNQNQQKECEVSWCSKKRAYFTRFCHRHYRAHRIWSHWSAKGIPKHAYKTFYTKALHLLERNMNHRGLQLALERLEGVFYLSTTRPDMPRALAVIYEKEPKLLEVLAVLIAVTAYREFFPARYPTDEFYKRMLAHSVINHVLRKVRKRIPKQEWKYCTTDGWVKAAIGKELYEALYPFLISVATKIVYEEQEQAKTKALLEEPLV